MKREETIQVNAISTTLLAVLLLPLLKEQQRRKGKPSHLVFVGSGTHIDVDIKQWPSYVTQDGGIMAHYAKKENYPPGVLDVKMYGISKLLLHYTAEDVSKLALGSNGEYVFKPPTPPFFPPPPTPLISETKTRKTTLKKKAQEE